MSIKIRILYIDDYELDRELVRDSLEREHGGFELTEASNRQEFETLLKNQEFDLILSDFNIAGFEGLQVLEAVQALDPQIPVIIVTGTGSEEIAAQALKQGAADYVIKRPKHIRRLPQTILSAIEKQKFRHQHRQAETALKESEEKFRNISENSLVGIYIIHDDIFTYVNPKFAEIFGYCVEECLDHMHFRQLVHPEDFATVQEHVRKRAYGESESAQYAFRGIKKDGEIIHVEIFGSSVILSGKRAVTGTMLDITNRKKAEEALRQSHNRFLTVLDSIDATIYVADFRTHEILFMNRCMVNSFGRDMTGEICWNAFRKESGPCPHCSNDRLIDEKGKPAGVHVWQGRNPITLKWYINYDRAIEWTDGRLVRLQIATDITEMKILEEKLRQAQKMETIGQLAGGIAHDFNNLLSSILGYTELSLDEVSKGTSLEDHLQEVYAAGKRARDLIKQISVFARQSDEERKPIKVDTILKEVLKFIRSTIPTTIEIEQEIESHSLIMGNSTHIHQIFMNLCTNAAQAMEDTGGILKVELKDVVIDGKSSLKQLNLRRGSYLKIAVSDTGCGIGPDIIGSIFEPYFTTKGIGEGTGMGLAVAHGIVESYSGKITVDSKLGKGTVLSIYLPITQKNRYYQLLEKNELPFGTEHILFVDDELPIAKMSSQVLERLGYQVTVCTSSAEALELFRSKPSDFDLVITDMTMPNMTGDKLALNLISLRSDIPVILCTGYSKKMTDANASKIGIKAFAYKPIVKAELAKTVRKVLNEAKGSTRD